MPFAFCLHCADQALIDPSGRCPEGHEVGAAGARVAAGIGSATPHPDEPVPWTRTVELHPDRIGAAAPRVARPPTVGPAATAAISEGVAAPAAAATEDVFAELHALSELDGPDATTSAAPRPSAPSAPPAPATTGPPAPSVPTPAAPPTPSAPPIALQPPAGDDPAPRPPLIGPAHQVPRVPDHAPVPPVSPEATSDLEDLAGLVAAMQSLDSRDDEPTAVPAASTPPPAPPVGALSDAAARAADELDDMFAADVRRGALADVAALDRDAAGQGTAPAPETPPTPPPAPPRLDDLDFTAKSGRPRRGLFRR